MAAGSRRWRRARRRAVTHASATAAAERIESLDVLRGFAVLGILLLNIIGFGAISAGYFHPEYIGTQGTAGANLAAWAGVNVLFEGAMRALFSMLFGAGIVMFTTGSSAKSGSTHYKRTLWLFAFGLIDIYVLLWSGDVLALYALAGAVLYWVRNVSARRLLAAACALLVLLTLQGMAFSFGLGEAKRAASIEGPAALQPEVRAYAKEWRTFAADAQPDVGSVERELTQRGASYASAWHENAEVMQEVWLFDLPFILFWDALTMMLLGMSFYKFGVLNGARSRAFYWVLLSAGFSAGLTINLYEVNRAIASDFSLLQSFDPIQPTYHWGRLGMALGYLALVMLICQSGRLLALRGKLQAVGRMALSNYLVHSAIALLLFSGAGFGLVGKLSLIELYSIVLGIWLLQLWYSPLWLRHYRFGPAEWLWRRLTYGG